MDTDHTILLILLYLGATLFLGTIFVGVVVFYKTELKRQTLLGVNSIKEYVDEYQWISSVGLAIVGGAILLSLIFG